MLRRVKAVDIGIKHEKCIRIPQCPHELPLSFLNGLAMETVRKPRCGVNVEVPADRVRAISSQRLKRIYRVPFRLAHLLSLLILNMPKHNDIFKTGIIKQQRGLRQQRVKPSSRLVYCLGNKLGRILLLKQLLIFKRIMMLCERHRPRIKPAVDHLRHTLHRAAAFRALDRDLIDIGPVQLYRARFPVAAHLFQLFPAANGMHLSAPSAFPYVQRRSPIAVPGNAPILDILQPVPEASFSNRFGNPVDRIVIADQVLLHRRHLNEPGLAGIIDQRRIAAPAVGITVFKFGCVKQKPLLFQIRKNHRICLLAENTFVIGLFCHFPFCIHQLYKRQVVISSHVGIVLAECGGDVNNAGTVGQSDIGVTCYIICLLPLFFAQFHRIIKQRFIFLIFQVFARIPFQYFICRNAFFFISQLPKHRIQ